MSILDDDIRHYMQLEQSLKDKNALKNALWTVRKEALNIENGYSRMCSTLREVVDICEENEIEAEVLFGLDWNEIQSGNPDPGVIIEIMDNKLKSPGFLEKLEKRSNDRGSY